MPPSFPNLITFRIDGDDAWLRATIRGEAFTEPIRTQRVIVQDSREADRVSAAMANLKLHRGKPYGGCVIERWLRPGESF